jgi:hypothetical protein
MLELHLGRVVGCTEAYLMMAATRKLKPSLLAPLPPPSPVDATTQRLRDATRHFGNLVKIWVSDLKVDPAMTTRWSDFETLRHVRHVVVHRLGYWQPALDPKPMLATRVAAIGVNPDFYRGPMPMSDVDLTEAIAILRATVIELDPQL